MGSKFSEKPRLTFEDYINQSEQYGIEKPCAIDEQNKNVRKDNCVGTLTTDGSSPKKNNRVLETSLRIRKLTPSECFALMGFSKEDCKRAADGGISNSQLYKQAGNSICVSVLEAIYKSLGSIYDEFSSKGVLNE